MDQNHLYTSQNIQKISIDFHKKNQFVKKKNTFKNFNNKKNK